MKNLIEEVLLNYLDKSKRSVMHEIISKLMKGQIENNLSLDQNKYLVKGSIGNGNQSFVPWIAIFLKSITTTAQEGYYIVYLFKEDMTGVYLSLNQGWTFFKNNYGTTMGKEKIKSIANYWKNNLIIQNEHFDSASIELTNSNKNNLGRGYEAGHIIGKLYSIDDIPEDKELFKDLKNMILVYENLNKSFNVNKFENINKKILIEEDLDLTLDKNEEENINFIENNLDDFDKQSNLILTEPPQPRIRQERQEYNFRGRKIDFEKKNKAQKKLGHAGELMVLKYERDFLIKNNHNDLAEKVKHVSVLEGDGTGYDILSFDLNGKEKYIEVKTTTKDNYTEFIMSNTELEFAEKNKDNYYIYRVYNFKTKEMKGNLFIVQFDDLKNYKKTAIQFKFEP